MEVQVSICSPSSGPYSSTCGYCSPSGQRTETRYNRFSASLDAIVLSCQVYQEMIDRGWRRSGTYCYKPDLRNSCCLQYTIKLDALNFSPSKSQRKLLSRWNKFITEGNGDGSEVRTGEFTGSKTSKKNMKFELLTAVHAAEVGWCQNCPEHRFEITLEPSSYTEEKFSLFEKYQTEIHHDLEKEPSGFSRFLVETPLKQEPIPYSKNPPGHLPTHYGSYHQLYRVNGELIAMAVLDILPSCVSSVYFMYDKNWGKYSLGKVSAMREAALAKEIHDAGVSSLTSLYMGFYIHSCQKMKYKGEYSPSFLADPVTFRWYALSECVKQLEKNRYACFSNPEETTAEPPARKPMYSVPPIALSTEIQDMLVIESVQNRAPVLTPFNKSRYWVNETARNIILHCVAGLGMETATKILFGI